MGFGSVYWQLSCTHYSFPEKESVYKIKILEKPEIKENSLLYPAETSGKKVLLYFSKDSMPTILRGDKLLISSRISAPRNNGNPDEFDYSSYLTRKGISGTGYVSDKHWQLIKHDSTRSFKQIALDCREEILKLYRKIGFSGDEYAILSALTVGYKEELSEEVRESFSISGASHVLALSGLHIGFIYVLLLWILNRVLPKNDSFLWVKIFIILSILWGFAFVTGFSASVVRSVIMFSILAVSQARSNKLLSFNSLITAALCMLVYHPVWLFDVGFQLSFVAVLSILFIQPWLYNKLPVTSRVGKYIWGILTVSLAAQVGVAPLILFYFSRFSTHFLLTNLLVIPLVSFIIYVALLILLLTPFPALQSIIVYPLKWLLILLNHFVRWVEQLPVSSFDNIWLYKSDVLVYYVIILLIGIYVYTHKPRYILSSLLCILICTVYRGWSSREDIPEDSIVFYNTRNCPVVHCISSNSTSWLVYADSIPNPEQLSYAASGYWRHLQLPQPKTITSNYYVEDAFSRYANIISFNGKRICIINDDSWLKQESKYIFSVDYLYICRGYKGELKSLMKLFSAKTVVLDSSLPVYKKESFSEECRTFNIPYRSLAEGASISRIHDKVLEPV